MDYTPRELSMIADQLLADDANAIDPETGKRKGIKGDNAILLSERQDYDKWVQNKNGYPEPEIASGMYWRTHPEGRKVNSKEQREKNGAGWWR